MDQRLLFKVKVSTKSMLVNTTLFFNGDGAVNTSSGGYIVDAATDAPMVGVLNGVTIRCYNFKTNVFESSTQVQHLQIEDIDAFVLITLFKNTSLQQMTLGGTIWIFRNV